MNCAPTLFCDAIENRFVLRVGPRIASRIAFGRLLKRPARYSDGEIHALHPEENNVLAQPIFANSREKKRAQKWNSDLY
jgi:hypothetical protein